MINPSANGWIDKFFLEQQVVEAISDTDSFYQNIRLTGFIYGHVVSFSTPRTINTKGWLHDEVSKVAMLNALYQMYTLTTQDVHPKQFIEKAASFYDKMNPQGFSLFRKMIPGQSVAHHLEKIIDERVHTNDNIISKNFSHIVTNALLFVDVLAFQQYLTQGEVSDKYLKKIEETIISVVTLALQTKTNKSPHDKLLVKLFEASVRYTKFSKANIQNLDALQLEYYQHPLEKYYLIDIAGLALWSDGMVEKDEAYFLHTLAATMDVPDAFVTKSISDTHAFISKYLKEIPYFNYSNPVKHFYDQTTQLVITLITRNKKRLAKEISESKELMVLLAHSTQRDLDKDEKKKIKKQLLDICKSIPSLTIFLIPGGSLLLPILIKFIPQMLPSAFNENLDEE
ncbi:LETM1-related biofilm-associated protein [Flavobacterium caeni]|uniref:LETM1-like protein n=1 Tax=Flavobacterium caeni TaxID=490189 RepID=A0A1G5CER7_9FLAO|nr:LETM1-related biofilm-associated protein [Flavobacterium caeni]SCY00794.1 LETM1-like protein [Flavobacterium caeni]